MNMIARRRWSDNDRYLGPFTYSRDTRGYRPLALILSSTDDEDSGCGLRLSGFGHTLIIALPPVIRPWRRWVDTSKYEWSRSPAGGYWDVHRREYGFSISEGFLHVALGPQTHDSTTTKDWSWFLPWTQWRHVRFSLYGLDGEHFWTERDRKRGAGYEAQRAAEDVCPKLIFAFTDYDGETLAAITHIEEREWHFGTGWFKWLSLFRRPKIRRSLDIDFSGETGPEKGSWKGGTVGHSIDMLPGELHEAAFRRYCAEHRMTFTEPASA